MCMFLYLRGATQRSPNRGQYYNTMKTMVVLLRSPWEHRKVDGHNNGASLLDHVLCQYLFNASLIRQLPFPSPPYSFPRSSLHRPLYLFCALFASSLNSVHMASETCIQVAPVFWRSQLFVYGADQKAYKVRHVLVLCTTSVDRKCKQ